MTDHAWLERAACKGQPTQLFYPPETLSRLNVSQGNIDRQRQESAAALAYCQRCPVVDDCLRWALAVPEPCGIWGNTTDLERRRLRKQMRQRDAA